MSEPRTINIELLAAKITAEISRWCQPGKFDEIRNTIEAVLSREHHNAGSKTTPGETINDPEIVERMAQEDMKPETTEENIKDSIIFLENLRDMNKHWKPTYDAYQTCINLLEELNAQLYS